MEWFILRVLYVVVAVLLGAAVLASFIPSRRATRVAPGVVMGSE